MDWKFRGLDVPDMKWKKTLVYVRELIELDVNLAIELSSDVLFAEWKSK